MLAIAWGAAFAVAGVVLGIPAVARNGVFSSQSAFHLLLALLAGLHMYAGLGILARRAAAPALATSLGIVLVSLAAFVPAPLLVTGAVVGVTIAVLLLAGRPWRPRVR